MKSATSAREILLPFRGSASPSILILPVAGVFVSIGGITIVQSSRLFASSTY